LLDFLRLAVNNCLQNAGTMNITAETTAVPLKTEDHHHRRHTLNPHRTWLGRCGIAVQNAMEWAVARVSPLGDPHIYDRRDFPWTAVLERDWQLIRKELDMVMTYRDQMPSFQEILKEVGAIQSDHQWKTFFLAGIGMDCTENRRRCPETVRLLEKIPGLTTAFFSILSPGKHIPAHRGAWNGILRLHLGLLVPEPRERVRIRIGNDFYSWREGEVLIFDDTFNHEVWNDTTGYRVVLFVDFARPLHAPFHWLNLRLLHLGTLAPFLREAGEKQKRWQDAFWKKLPGRDAAPK
jgi:beta-hydroxylase